jgi:PAS domain S-box-containing protein
MGTSIVTVSWIPVQCTDIIGSILALYLAVACLTQAWQLFKSKSGDIFRHYIFLLTTAFVIFAISRSSGHLVKQILLLSGKNHIWHQISPFSGAINTATFVTIFAISLYYQRVKKVHSQIELYNLHLEDMVAERTMALEEANTALEDEVIERKQIEQALLEEKERLAVTLRSIGDGVITTDTEGRIVLINKVTEHLTGWRQEEAVGLPISEVFNIIDEKDRSRRENPVNKVLESGQIVDLANHTALIAKDGTERSIADSGAPIHDQDSKIVGVVLVFRDITKENKLHAELMKTEKLESVGVLAGGIAHDFNNILMAIMGNLSLAEHFLDPTDKAFTLIKAAAKASIRAKDLTQQLLTFSRGGDPIKEAAQIRDIIQDSADFVLHGSKIKCQYNITDDLCMVSVDKGQMSQVIQNLIINARQAMADVGDITITCENIPKPKVENFPALDLDCKYIKVTIADTGPGIPSKAMHKIFDPYFTTKEMGSGLGLAITNSIIGKHDGFIRVDSSPAGTVFTIYLPVAGLNCERERPTPASISSVVTVPSHGKILLMDDEKMVRDVADTILTLSGYVVMLAVDGQEAVDIYQKAMQTDSPIDAVIMDLTVPGGMGGKDASKEILNLDPAAKILVSSGYSNDPVMSDYLQYGFCGSIIKPYEMKDLQKALADIL